MAMAATQPHGTLTAMDGASIPFRVWGDDRARHALVLLHEGASYSRWYDRLAHGLEKHDVAVLAYDQRGFGDWAGPRGHSPRFSFYLDDCAIALSAAVARWPLAQVSLCGHGFGGLVALRYCLDRANRQGIAPASLILMAPWIKDRLPVRKRMMLEGLVRSVTRPTKTYQIPISVYETGDPDNAELLAQVEADPLIVRAVSGRWLVGASTAKLGLLRRARALRTPVLQIEVTEDALVDSDTNRLLFVNLGSQRKRLVVLPGFHHAMQYELDVTPLVEVISEFLAVPSSALA